MSLSSLASRCRALPALFLSLGLAACAGGHGAAPAANYDFGPSPAVAAGHWPLGLELRLAPWLDTPALHYRLAYEDPARLAAYTQSRWVAPVGQLLNLRLRQQLGATAGPCRLRIEVDEFTQIFDAPEVSRGVLQGRMTLWDKQGRLLNEHSISVDRPAPSADARGGVVALSRVADAFAMDIGGRLSALEREGKLGSCR